MAPMFSFRDERATRSSTCTPPILAAGPCGLARRGDEKRLDPTELCAPSTRRARGIPSECPSPTTPAAIATASSRRNRWACAESCSWADSFVEAQGVVASASAVRLVEQALRRESSAVEVWNLRVPHRDFPDLEDIFSTAFELEPDVLIYGMVLNDVDRDPPLTKSRPRVNDWIMVREKTPSWLERHSYVLSFVEGRYATMRVSRDTTAWYRALYSDENQAGWMRTRAAWLRIKARCESQGISFGVALWPLLVGLEDGATYPFDAAHAQIRKGLERAQIPLLDLLPRVRGRRSSSLWVHESDLHPNEVAQALVAPALTHFVRGLARTGPKTDGAAPPLSAAPAAAGAPGPLMHRLFPSGDSRASNPRCGDALRVSTRVGTRLYVPGPGTGRCRLRIGRAGARYSARRAGARLRRGCPGQPCWPAWRRPAPFSIQWSESAVTGATGGVSPPVFRRR